MYFLHVFIYQMLLNIVCIPAFMLQINDIKIYLFIYTHKNANLTK